MTPAPGPPEREQPSVSPPLTRVMVFGASGFIGDSITRKLAASLDAEVIGYSSSACDLLSVREAEVALGDADDKTTVVVAAGITRSIEDSLPSLARNVRMVHNLLGAIPDCGLRSTVFLSSVDVYGRSQRGTRISEATSLDPESPYAISKYICEELLFSQEQSCGPVTALRLPQVYGLGDYARSIVGMFINYALLGQDLPVHGSGQTARDWVEVDDVADVALDYVRSPISERVNLATGTSHTINELVGIIERSLEQKLSITYVPIEGPETTLEFDVTKLRSRSPGFMSTALGDGVEKYIKSFRTQQSST